MDIIVSIESYVVTFREQVRLICDLITKFSEQNRGVAFIK
jgi:hypothetical protein